MDPFGVTLGPILVHESDFGVTLASLLTCAGDFGGSLFAYEGDFGPPSAALPLHFAFGG